MQKIRISFTESVFVLYYDQVGHKAEQGHVPAVKPEEAFGIFLSPVVESLRQDLEGKVIHYAYRHDTSSVENSHPV